MDDAVPVRASSASAISMPKRRTCSSGSGPRARRAASVSPSSNSMHQIVDAVLAADVVQGADVRVVQRSRSPGLALEPCAELGVAGQCPAQDLHRDAAIQARVARPIHLAHATRAEA